MFWWLSFERGLKTRVSKSLRVSDRTSKLVQSQDQSWSLGCSEIKGERPSLSTPASRMLDLGSWGQGKGTSSLGPAPALAPCHPLPLQVLQGSPELPLAHARVSGKPGFSKSRHLLPVGSQPFGMSAPCVSLLSPSLRAVTLSQACSRGARGGSQPSCPLGVRED